MRKGRQINLLITRIDHLNANVCLPPGDGEVARASDVYVIEVSATVGAPPLTQVLLQRCGPDPRQGELIQFAFHNIEIEIGFSVPGAEIARSPCDKTGEDKDFIVDKHVVIAIYLDIHRLAGEGMRET